MKTIRKRYFFQGGVFMANIMECLIPISQFNKGQAAKIFNRLKETKELFVLKNNQPLQLFFLRKSIQGLQK